MRTKTELRGGDAHELDRVERLRPFFLSLGLLGRRHTEKLPINRQQRMNSSNGVHRILFALELGEQFVGHILVELSTTFP